MFTGALRLKQMETERYVKELEMHSPMKSSGIEEIVVLDLYGEG